MSLAFLFALACGTGPVSGLAGQDSGCEPVPWYTDADGDGYGAGPSTEGCTAPPGTVDNDGDCNDADASVNPAATEVCNGLDDDCDRMADPPAVVGRVDCYRDADADGFGDPTAWIEACACPDGYVQDDTDCDDADPAAFPGAPETWYDGVDQDCAADSDFDADGDGFEHEVDDCDDTAAAVHPGAEEVCGNGLDDDCDGQPGDCGLEGAVSSEEATTRVVDDQDWTTWSLGTATDDVDGDGLPELMVTRHGHTVGDTSRLEYYLVSLRRKGTELLSAAQVAKLVYETTPDAWSTIGNQSSHGSTDLDGDGYADYLLGAQNHSAAWRAPNSRIFLEYGPLIGEVGLATAAAAVANSDDEYIGGGIGAIETRGAGRFTIATGVEIGDHSGAAPIVRFLDQDHFTGVVAVDDAPTLWAGDTEEAARPEPAAIRDIDGDGIGDVIIAIQDTADLTAVRSLVFLGPFPGDITTEDAEAELDVDPEGEERGLATAACSAPSGSTWIVADRWEEELEGDSVLHQVYEWGASGLSDDHGALVEVRAAGGGSVSSCGGDLDGDGAIELAAERFGYGSPIAGGESAVLVLEVPKAGSWDIADLAYADLYVPDSSTPDWRGLDIVQGVDFDGDDVDDFVSAIALNPEGDGLGDIYHLLMYSGEPTGF